MDLTSAAAEAVALCRPGFVSASDGALPSSLPRALRDELRRHRLAGCEFADASSDSAALLLGMEAAAAGIRTYAATGSASSLLMAEAAYSAADRGLPMVMTVANAPAVASGARGGDQVESIALRDSGWIHLYPENTQEAVDLHIQAFRLAESLSCPVMIDVDGLIAGGTAGSLSVPSQFRVDAFVPPFERPQLLEQIGIGPSDEAGHLDGSFENRYIQHHKQLRALDLIEALAEDFSSHFRRASGGLVRTHYCDDAATVIVSIGSLVPAIMDVVEELRHDGQRIGLLSICSFRPFPLRQIRDALSNASRVVVVERWLAAGMGGILSDSVRKATCGTNIGVQTIICGVGGRMMEKQVMFEALLRAARDELEQLTFLGLDWDVVNRQLERQRLQRRSRIAAARTLRTVRNARAEDRASS
jgi:pyruvate ferredoxin oxidoreductase alpha subunit